MKITICIGSSCHMKGSGQIVEKLQDLVAKNGLKDTVDLDGTFCTGNCTNGVSVTVDGRLYSLSAGTVEDFFNKEIIPRFLNGAASASQAV
ncbi:MAG: (2Fe-2S) ferredoxin domain-containing protein [Clostridiaceae bacterium]|nr:(2Fe-2S) ferredoxin domain-containing protein [Clostridiaceae bacterium]